MAVGPLRTPGPQDPEPGEPTTPTAGEHAEPRRALWGRPVVRAGVVAWAIVGILVIAAVVGVVLTRLSVVVVPLTVALFPAAVLVPPTEALRRRGMSSGLAALIVLVVSIGLLVGLFSILTPLVAAELGGLAESLEEGYAQVRGWLAERLRIETLPLDQALEQLSEQVAAQGGNLGDRVLEAGGVLVEGFAGVALLLFSLFFYLKDGPRIASWIRSLFPRTVREEVQGIGDRVWFTIGGYIRGLLVIGLVDAVLIGTGLLVLGVPLALPLSVLVFFGALFPIVGAFIAGTVAVLVALATKGVGVALLVLLLIVVVQQLEGHILTPILLGRATELHPLAVIVSLTAGAVLFGIVGAFLSVPIAASIARALSYLRERRLATPA